MIREEKQLLRARMKEALRAFTRRETASQAIRGLLHSSSAWRQARVIYGYIPMASEPDWLGRDWPEDKILAFPRTNGEGNMQFFCSREFQIGPWKAHEPVGNEIAPDPDIILIPGLAFDHHGHRMGRGGGFYDRWLEAHPSGKKIGLCFQCQIVGHLPREPHDLSMDLILTEGGSPMPPARG